MYDQYDLNSIVLAGSLSPARGRFEDSTVDAKHAEAMSSALKEVASSSGKNSQLSGGWTSSDDDADPMDQDGVGSKFPSFVVTMDLYLLFLIRILHASQHHNGFLGYYTISVDK